MAVSSQDLRKKASRDQQLSHQRVLACPVRNRSKSMVKVSQKRRAQGIKGLEYRVATAAAAGALHYFAGLG